MLTTDGGNLSYPIIKVVPLGAPERRWLRGDRRNPSQIPFVGPSEALVVQVAGRCRLLPLEHFRGDEAALVEATSVAVVDTANPRVVTVGFEIPSARPSEHFSVSVGFRCHVENPVEVVQKGVVDLPARLKSYLDSYPELMSMGQEFDVGQVSLVREAVAATLQSIGDLMPFGAPGMSVELSAWEVKPSQGLVEFDQKEVGLERDWRIREQELNNELQKNQRWVKHRANLRDNYGETGILDEYESLQREDVSPAEAAARTQKIRAENDRDERERADKKAEQDRQDRLQIAQWNRDDRIRKEEREAQSETKRAELRVRLLQVFAERGLIDLRADAVDKVIDEVLEIALPGRLESGAKEIPSQAGSTPGAARPDYDADIPDDEI